MSDKRTINNTLINDFVILIHSKKNNTIIEELAKFHVADIAEIINQLSSEEAKYLFKLITDEEKSAAILVELEDNTRENLLADLTAKEIAEEVIENLETDDAADLIGELTKERKEKVFSHIEDVEHASDIHDLLSYPDNSAGSIMGKELIKVNENWTTLQCLKEMRKQANTVKKVYTIYVVNNSDVLVGLLSLRKLLITKQSTKIKNIKTDEIIAVKVNENNEGVVNIMQKYNLIALPVIDDLGKLIGRITVDDVMDVAKDEAEKDYQLASGIFEDVEITNTVWELTRARLPWLIIGMIGGILGAKVIGIFDIKSNYELAFFIPLIAAMGGNVGVQSAAIVVQGLANETVKMENLLQKLIKELGVGLLNGIICSIIILLTTITLGYSLKLSISVSISLLAVIIFAAIFGTFIPLSLKKHQIDPALATGPFITTLNDVLGLLIYFWIGQSIL